MPIASVYDQLDSGVLQIVANKVALPPLKLVASYRNNLEMDILGALALIALEEREKFSSLLEKYSVR